MRSVRWPQAHLCHELLSIRPCSPFGGPDLTTASLEASSTMRRATSPAILHGLRSSCRASLGLGAQGYHQADQGYSNCSRPGRGCMQAATRLAVRLTRAGLLRVCFRLVAGSSVLNDCSSNDRHAHAGAHPLLPCCCQIKAAAALLRAGRCKGSRWIQHAANTQPCMPQAVLSPS
jgi:hypothetical protein